MAQPDPITADQIKTALTTGNPPRWVQQAALLMHPNDWGKAYDTTACNFFPEVTIRLPPSGGPGGLTRRGKPRLQRRRLDLVALVQPNYRVWAPFTIGVEIKVDKSDLMHDEKMLDYLPFVHLFYLAVPISLSDDVLTKISGGFEFDNIGLLAINDKNQVANSTRFDVITWGKPAPMQPTPENLSEVYAELLLRPFKRAGKQCKTFVEFERSY